MINILKIFRRSNYYEKNVGDFTYDFDWIGLFCDTLVSDYSDGRKMEDFLNRTNIKLNELLSDCRNMIKTNFRDDFFGDENNSVILLAESNLIKEVLHYMKQKIDEDMKEKVEINVSDFSKPKMLIYSGHDSTLSGEELFMIKHFGLTIDDYIYPTYTTQLAFEVTRDDEKPKPLSYSSYNVTFYVNDKPLIVKNFDEFKKTVEKSVWNAKQINDFCDDDAVESDNNSNSSSPVQLYLTICLGVLSFIFLMIIIILVMKINQKTKESETNNNEGPLVNEDEN